MDDLRPADWDDFIGQSALKEALYIHANSAVERMEPLVNILLVARPGCGKTSLAKLVAEWTGRDYITYTMPQEDKVIQRVAANLEGILILDEFHQATPGQQKSFLNILEDGYYQMSNGTRIETSFSVIAATTNPERILEPVRDRFKIMGYVEYTAEEMGKIAYGMATRMGLDWMDENSAMMYGECAAGTPRQVKDLLYMARDMYVTLGKVPAFKDVLSMCRITDEGLTENHLLYLKTLAKSDGQSGLDMLSNHMHFSKGALVELERLLVKRGHIAYSKKGRELTSSGWKMSKYEF